MDLAQVEEETKRLSPWAHLATVGADGEPDVVPIHPAWEDGVLWALVDDRSVKVRNVAVNAQVALHWQVGPEGDGVEVWGTAAVWDDVDTKRRLWTGVFDYNLDDFAPGGPDNSPRAAFLSVTPARAVVIRQYGIGGIERWSAG